MRKFILSSLAVLVTSSFVYADTLLTVDNTASTIHYTQQTGAPCIYGYPSCKNGGFPAFTSIQVGGNDTIVDAGTVANNPSNGLPVLFTTTAALIKGLGVGGQTWIGFDVNESVNTTINILQFDVVDMTTSTTLAHLNTNTPLATFANGTGFSDALLKGLDLTSISGTDQIQFSLRYDDASDGTEQVFLISQNNPPPPIPEPASIVLLGTAFLSTAYYLRRRGRA
jgi:hypothetical protein